MSKQNMGFDASKAISGKDGKVWWDDELVFEATSLSAKVTLTKVKVPMCGKRGTQEKVVGHEGTGSMTMTKIFSRTLKMLSDDIKKGITPSFNIMSEITDPNVSGEERVVLRGVIFNEIDLINWGSDKDVVTETLNFTFSDWEVLSTNDED